MNKPDINFSIAVRGTILGTDQPCQFTLFFYEDTPLYGMTCQIENEDVITWQSMCFPDHYLTDIVFLGNLLCESPKTIDQYFDFSLWAGPKFVSPRARKAAMMAGTDTCFGYFLVAGHRFFTRKPAEIVLRFFPLVISESKNNLEDKFLALKLSPEEAKKAGMELLEVADQLIDKHDVHGIWWDKFGRQVEPKIVEESEGKYPLFEPPPDEQTADRDKH